MRRSRHLTFFFPLSLSFRECYFYPLSRSKRSNLLEIWCWSKTDDTISASSFISKIKGPKEGFPLNSITSFLSIWIKLELKDTMTQGVSVNPMSLSLQVLSFWKTKGPRERFPLNSINWFFVQSGWSLSCPLRFHNLITTLWVTSFEAKLQTRSSSKTCH